MAPALSQATAGAEEYLMYARRGTVHPSAGCCIRKRCRLRSEVCAQYSATSPHRGAGTSAASISERIICTRVSLTRSTCTLDWWHPAGTCGPASPVSRNGYVHVGGTTKLPTEVGTRPHDRPIVNDSSATKCVAEAAIASFFRDSRSTKTYLVNSSRITSTYRRPAWSGCDKCNKSA